MSSGRADLELSPVPGFRARLGRATAQLETRLWNAELDLAIAEAVLKGPKGWGGAIVKEDVPATGPPPKVTANLETLEAFRKALSVQEGEQERKDVDEVKRQRFEEVKNLLTSNAEFSDADGSTVAGRNDIAEWLLKDVEAAKRIATPPELVIAAEPGVLVTHVATGGDICCKSFVSRADRVCAPHKVDADRIPFLGLLRSGTDSPAPTDHRAGCVDRTPSTRRGSHPR
jgi:hypothetical protein